MGYINEVISTDVIGIPTNFKPTVINTVLPSKHESVENYM